MSLDVKCYRRVPVVLEAVQFTYENWESVAQWCGGLMTFDFANKVAISIPTLEGDILASLGDYVVKGLKGEFWPVKPDVFVATYEPA